MSNDYCAVYLFGYPHHTFGHVVKVGISNNAGARLAQIQSHNPDIVQCHFRFDFGSRDLARKVESRFHENFSPYGIRGEWFGMSDRHALFLLTMMVVRCLSESYSREVIPSIRQECGVLRAFEILDGLSDEEQEAWNEEWLEVMEVAFA